MIEGGDSVSLDEIKQYRYDTKILVTAHRILAYSESESTDSPHYADEKWKRVHFTETELAQHITRSYSP